MLEWKQADADQAQKLSKFVTGGTYTLTGMQIIEFFGCIKWFNKVCNDISDTLLPPVPEVKHEQQVDSAAMPDASVLAGLKSGNRNRGRKR